MRSQLFDLADVEVNTGERWVWQNSSRAAAAVAVACSADSSALIMHVVPRPVAS